ncbi:bifunctional 3-demethylubiquinone-9 3-methyltransferase/ 2-octaprenyl-6-hydroxy phenol methylase [Bacteroidales bacterium Barb4]|nr:bifunctional 3-demethylubiquinone-9 3-methyltransferase/ 2-octaprenyl-6-hydroxy phenol methylase [Bacteroidales bacterium Barb4]
MTIESNSTGFTEQQYAAIYPDGIGNHYWVKSRNKIIAKAIRQYSSTGKGLEIGCGKGIVIDYLNRHNFDFCGIEIADVIPLSSVKDKIRTYQKVEDLTSDYCSQFETILLLDVIEHLPDPAVFLRQLKYQFKNLKIIIITVPACMELFSNYDEFNGHFRRYDLEAVTRLAKNIDAELIWEAYFFHILYLLARLTLLLFGKRKLYMTTPNRLIKWIHDFLAHCLYFDCLFFSKKWKGSSIISVFQV